jgi:hypothetical protein
MRLVAMCIGTIIESNLANQVMLKLSIPYDPAISPLKILSRKILANVLQEVIF